MFEPSALVAPRCDDRLAYALVDFLDEGLAAHARRVARLATAVADELDVAPEVRHDVELGALLHDIGKLAIPPAILGKAGPLDFGEREVMRTHVIEGERLAAEIEGLPATVPAVVRASHERWDGRGYPDRLRGEQIPLAARIVAVADALDAMTSCRCYCRSMPLERAIAKVRADAGRHFDPEVTDALALVAGTTDWSGS
jgi:putative nucleotidyltransferase with HDIG domain